VAFRLDADGNLVVPEPTTPATPEEAATAALRARLAVLEAQRASLLDPPTPTWAPGDPPLRIGGNVKEPKKIKNVPPVYPVAAQEARVQGIVIIEAEIDQDGRVANARVIRPVPMLDDAALDAVLQWEFMPTLLDGQPVPVIMTVTVNFTLQETLE
jgi:protein TonB